MYKFPKKTDVNELNESYSLSMGRQNVMFVSNFPRETTPFDLKKELQKYTHEEIDIYDFDENEKNAVICTSNSAYDVLRNRTILVCTTYMILECKF